VGGDWNAPSLVPMELGGFTAIVAASVPMEERVVHRTVPAHVPQVGVVNIATSHVQTEGLARAVANVVTAATQTVVTQSLDSATATPAGL
ncbi:hypothetical protein scyTo_0023772, partial [Scyliorhinus torazame]|nr:hypothetical protein [Scyliorhinus torazame]